MLSSYGYRNQVNAMKWKGNQDEALVEVLKATLRTGFANAEEPAWVVRTIRDHLEKQRCRGRTAAIRSHPFSGICECSGQPMDPKDRILDDREAEKGFSGKVRWGCPKCLGKGLRSCGVKSGRGGDERAKQR